MDIFETISSLDGRYKKDVQSLTTLFNEKSLVSHRILVEIEYLIFLSEHPKIETRKFSNHEKKLLRKLSKLLPQDFKRIRNIERKTNHDVKAVEYFLKEKLKITSLVDSLEWVHFGLTSEDINNLAYAMMMSDALGKVILPFLNKLLGILDKFARQNSNVSMLARTHGQPASPTTLGKEFRVFHARLLRQYKQLDVYQVSVKLNGATGNYNALYEAYPKIDWLVFSQKFIQIFNINRRIKLKQNNITTQIESGDAHAELFDTLRRVNTILIDCNQDIWRYISDGWLIQKVIIREIGSSTMPHKVNPIDFEKSEGNLGIANALFNHFSNKLPISRLQRDLSDSTVKRNIGVALGHSLIGYSSLLWGLAKIKVDKKAMSEAIDQHPEVIAEAIQMLLRKAQVELPYEKLKTLTRSRKVSTQDFEEFIDNLKVSDKLKSKLKKIEPKSYIGIADKLARTKLE